jgi:hypothetical protein
VKQRRLDQRPLDIRRHAATAPERLRGFSLQSPLSPTVGLCQNLAKSGVPACLAWGQFMGLSYLRFVVGAFVVAASLLIGNAAVADADSSDSAAPGPGGANASIEGSTTARQGSTRASRPVGDITDTPRAKIQRVMRALRAVRQSGQQPYTGAKKPDNGSGGTDIKDGTIDGSGSGAAVSDPVAAVPNEVAPVSDPVAAVPDEVAPVSDPVAAVPNVVAPVSDPATPLSVAVAPVPGVVGPVSSVSASVVPLAQLPSDLYFFLLGIAGVAPVSDVSALVQDGLTSVAGAVVPLAQLPSDLLSLLGIAGVPPVGGEVAGIHDRGLSGAAAASVASRLPLGMPPPGISGPPLGGVSGVPMIEATGGVATLDVIALGRASAASGMASPAPDSALPIGAGSSFRRVVGAIVLSVSLWALAAAALPGAGGLGFLTLAGVRVGYRQAKAGVALRTTGIAHFARPGPLGIVRSGSVIVVRPRGAMRVDRPQALTAEQLLDKVA